MERVLDLWMRSSSSRNKTKLYVVIDVFSGFGSVSDAIKARGLKNVFVFGNDILPNRHGGDFTFDMSSSSPFNLSSLIWLSCSKLNILTTKYKDIPDLLESEQISILFHLSTPCTTYSTDGMAYHRNKDAAQSPKTTLAHQHDEMNRKLIAQLQKLALF